MSEHPPMIAVERGTRGGYAVFSDGGLTKASNDAEGALVGVADLLDVSLLKLLREDESITRTERMQFATDSAARAVVELLVGVNAADRKINAIKAIRALSGSGLKDAKEAFEYALAKAV